MFSCSRKQFTCHWVGDEGFSSPTKRRRVQFQSRKHASVDVSTLRQRSKRSTESFRMLRSVKNKEALMKLIDSINFIKRSDEQRV